MECVKRIAPGGWGALHSTQYAFSKSLVNHEAALGLYFAHYNFCQKHGTIKTAPAVAAGLTDKPWTVADLIE